MSSDRLDRIEAAIEANNDQIRQLTGILQIAVRELESVQKESDNRIQILIDESRENNRQHAEFRNQITAFIDESRENNRQHAEFRNQITALNEALQSLLAQVLSRVNDLWERLVA
jgi:uncharacterized coiled-coil DUF342 family protein